MELVKILVSLEAILKRKNLLTMGSVRARRVWGRNQQAAKDSGNGRKVLGEEEFHSFVFFTLSSSEGLCHGQGRGSIPASPAHANCPSNDRGQCLQKGHWVRGAEEETL